MRGKFLFGAASAALMAFGFAPAASAQTADQPGDNTSQARLTAGQPVSGEVSPAGDTDWFRLNVQEGQRYHFTLDGVGDTDPIDTVLTIYDGQGNQIAFNDDFNGTLNSALDYAPSQSGEIFVEARGFNPEATGAYTLNVTASTLPADDAGNDHTTRARIAPGRAVNGSLEYEGDVDAYRLSVRAGQRYVITLNGAAGSSSALNDPLLRITDREGTELASNDDGPEGLNSRVEYIPQHSGDVFVEAHAFSDNATGAYTLNVAAERLPPESASADVNTRGRITIGQSVDSALDYAGDHDWFRVRLEGGQSYRFSLNGAGDKVLADPLVRIRDGRGTELASDDDGGDGLNSYLEFTAPSTGTYFVEAQGFTDDATGSYRLTAAAGDIPADATTDASLSADGDYREGTLNPGGDHDWYRLNLTDGQGVRIALNSLEGADALGDPMLVIYDANGAEVARDDDGGDGLNSWLEFQATTAGAYFVEARGFNDDAAGRYAISITAGEIGNSAEGAEPMQANGDPRVGLIGADGDADWFAIDMVEGRPYRFNLTSSEPSPLADPVLTLFDSEGHQVAQDDDGGTGAASYLTFASPTGGTYYAAVTSFNDTGTGHYTLAASDTDVPGSAGTDESLDASNDSRLSRIDMEGDIDSYRVQLEAGVHYLIQVSGAGDHPLVDPFLTIANSAGERVTSDDDSGRGADARLVFTPDNADVYYLQASGLGGSTGWYTVSIVRQ